ncbi:MAG: ScyD/ScyE family protein [Actinomycetota bacterium]
MLKRLQLRRFAALVVVCAAVVATTAGVASSDANRTREPVRVVADGLSNPRHLAVNEAGRIYVAEAGSGGDVLVDVALGGDPGPTCIGDTGRISRLVGGRAIPVIDGLPSAAQAAGGSCTGPGSGFAATGPHGVDVSRQNVTYSIGLAGNPLDRDLLAAGLPAAAALGTVNSPVWRMPAMDVAGFEAMNDPDGLGVDSNPYGVMRDTWRSTIAVDAGGNSLLEVHRTRPTRVIAVFGPRCVAWNLPFPNPIPDVANPCGGAANFPADAVPTAVATAADGDYLVSMLGGFPFNVGESVIYKIDADHRGTAVCSTEAFVPAAGCEVFAEGLTALVDLEVAPDGKVYAVQFVDGGIAGINPEDPSTLDGSVQILHRRTGEVVGSIVGLSNPGGVAIDYRDVYISNFSTAPGFGQVVAAKTLCTARFRAECLETRP